MKPPVVDYRTFRFSRIGEPQFRHLKLLYGWLVYFAFYFLTENLIPPERCHLIHCALDDLIPFNELFLIPYVFWYFLIVISLVWFALYSIPRFREFQTFILITQAIAMAIYILYPSRQELRPAEFVRDNPLTRLAGFLYFIDTNTGVCPSLHVAYSMGIASTWLKEKQAHPLWKGFILFSVILICISTTFVKQHSVIDVLAAVPVSLIAEFLIYGNYWQQKLHTVKQGESAY